MLFSIGSELIHGEIADGNGPWLAARLAALGIGVREICVLPDERAALVKRFREALGQTALLIATGGLGPTPDDLTREALAEALQVPLRPHPEALAALKRFFAVRGRPMPPANERQALLPEGATPLPNPCGTAPGVAWERGPTRIYLLPGVPEEMQAMFAAAVAPRLADGGPVRLTTALHTFGATESELAAHVEDLLAPGRNPEVGTTARHGIVTLRVRARGATHAEARRRLEETVRELERRLGPALFGREGETLAGVVGRLLRERQATLATAESCTGGLVAKLITDIPGSSDYFIQGVVSYANEAKVRLLGVPPELLAARGAVSPEVAEAMARGARERAGTTYALSLTGIAGPGGGTTAKPVGLVYIGLAHPGGVAVQTCRWGQQQPRGEIRLRSAHAALDLLRRCLLGLPVP